MKYMLPADALAAAGELAKACPILSQDGSVEVRPLWEVAAGK